MATVERLTGRRRYRVDDEGHVVLQVEVRRVSTNASYYSDRTPEWRDAKIGDITLHDGAATDP